MSCYFCGAEKNSNPLNGPIIELYQWEEQDENAQPFKYEVCQNCARAIPPLTKYQLESM